VLLRTGQEAPLGFSVEDTPVVGESWEVEKSLDERFGLERSLRGRDVGCMSSSPSDGASGVRSPAGSPNRPDTYSPVCAGDDDVGAVAPPDLAVAADRPGIVPLPMSEDGVRKSDPEGAPSSKSKLIRRLV